MVGKKADRLTPESRVEQVERRSGPNVMANVFQARRAKRAPPLMQVPDERDDVSLDVQSSNVAGERSRSAYTGASSDAMIVGEGCAGGDTLCPKHSRLGAVLHVVRRLEASAVNGGSDEWVIRKRLHPLQAKRLR